MTYVSVPKEAFDVLIGLTQTYPQYADLIQNIESDLNLRLWNGLSDNLITFSSKDELRRSQDLILLYNTLILAVEKAFNPMKLVLIVQNVVQNFSSIFTLLRKHGGSSALIRQCRSPSL
jgi:hypothetical protein